MAVVAVAAGASASSAAAATFSFDSPVVGEVINDCTGEAFWIDGTAHYKVTDNSTLAGVKSHIEMNLTGVTGTTATGVRYVMSQQSSDTQHADFDPFGSAQITLEQTINLTRQAESGALLTGDDFRLHSVAHLTVTNGVTTAEKTDLRADCR